MNPRGPRLPAEWEPQAGVMLTWPHAAGDWAGSLERVIAVFVDIGVAIARREPLLVVCDSVDAAGQARTALCKAGAPETRLAFAIAPSNDTWSRDHGPITTRTADGVVLNDFRFDGWGGRYEAALDDAITARLWHAGTFAGTPLQVRDLVLEGGAIETDGAGTLLATRSSILAPARNPDRDAACIAALLAEWLGLDRCLWLDAGAIIGDDTDAHIDTLARFSDPDTILYATAPPRDPDHAALRDMAAQLAAFRTRDGRPYRLLPLPFPGAHHDAAGRRLPAGYANFLVVDGAVLLPVYGVAADRAAAEVISGAFPGRDVVPIDCRALIAQNGSLHCLTMQFPAGVALRDTIGVDAA